MRKPEQIARAAIDDLLRAAGWQGEIKDPHIVIEHAGDAKSSIAAFSENGR